MVARSDRPHEVDEGPAGSARGDGKASDESADEVPSEGTAKRVIERPGPAEQAMQAVGCSFAGTLHGLLTAVSRLIGSRKRPTAARPKVLLLLPNSPATDLRHRPEGKKRTNPGARHTMGAV